MKTFKELQEKFFEHLKNLFSFISGKKDNELNESLINQGRTEEEKELIRDICEETDMENDLMNEYIKSENNLDEWSKKQIEDSLREYYPEASDEERNNVHEQIEKGLVEDIKSETDELAKEMNEITENIQEDGKEEQS